MQLIFTLIHKAWLFVIYLVSLVLSTFWVQDIFDHILAEKIKSSKITKRFKPLSGKDMIADLFTRTKIMVIFVITCQVISFCLSGPLAAGFEIFNQGLLIAFYCFEYKTAALGVDTQRGIQLFE